MKDTFLKNSPVLVMFNKVIIFYVKNMQYKKLELQVPYMITRLLKIT